MDLKNGDICELEYYNGITFGLYMDGYLYKNQDNDVMCQIGVLNQWLLELCDHHL